MPRRTRRPAVGADPLTGLAGRGALAGLQTRHRVVAALLVDVVGLKATNERHGFSAGDRLLREAAESLRRLAPDARVLVRLGGDELLAVFTGAAASTRAEAARAAAACHGRPPLRAGCATLGREETITEFLDRLYALTRGR